MGLLSSSKPALGARYLRALKRQRRVAHKAHSRWERIKNPAVDLWTTRRRLKQSAQKCYPSCRIKLLPMLPVAHNLLRRRVPHIANLCLACRGAGWPRDPLARLLREISLPFLPLARSVAGVFMGL